MPMDVAYGPIDRPEMAILGSIIAELAQQKTQRNVGPGVLCLRHPDSASQYAANCGAHRESARM